MAVLLNFAHRGAAGYCPENTMAAFKHAIELGATGIETDVQMTADGQLVLIHDESLQRTAGSPKLVKDVSLAELKQLDAGSWYDPAFKDERVPVLDELLELVQSTNLVVNLELKNTLLPYPGLEEAVVEAVTRYGLANRIIISSFNHYALVKCKQLAPEIRTGILYSEGLFEPWDYAATVGADALHANYHAVTPEWVAKAGTHGLVYHPWTVNEPEQMRMLVDAGVSGIITDYPDRLANILNR